VGIFLTKDLQEIINKPKLRDNFVAQKYIETPLLIHNRKFDIRQWVLVTNWNPLTVWIYAEPYVRFPASDFSFNDITNKYVHLSNNAVSKTATSKLSEGLSPTIFTSHKIDGNMWSLSQLTNYFVKEYGFDIWNQLLKAKVDTLVRNTMISAQDMFEEKST
jgi:tubulin monoglycylase TTLL3/8